jgi:hypothetical protein
MAIVIQGTQNQILMPDGSYLLGQVGGNASNFTSFSRFLVFAGSTGVNGDTVISFPFAFPTQCCRIIVSEAQAGGWGDDSMTIYGINVYNNSNFTVRGARKYNGGNMYSPASGISCNWVAVGY